MGLSLFRGSGGFADRRAPQESGHRLREKCRLVVVDVVPGIGYLDGLDARVQRAHAIGHGRLQVIGAPAPHHQRGARDRAQAGLQVHRPRGIGMQPRRGDARMVVAPGEAALRQRREHALQPLQSCLLGHRGPQRAHEVRCRFPVRERRGRHGQLPADAGRALAGIEGARAGILDHQPPHALPVPARIDDGVHPAHRMAQQVEGIQAQRIHDALQVGHIGVRVVVARRIPVGLATPPLVEGDHAEIRLQRGSQAREGLGIAADAVQHHHGPGRRAAPLGEVEPQPLEGYHLFAPFHGPPSDQAVPALDFRGLQSAQAGIEPAAGGKGPDQHHLVAVGAVRELRGDRVVVRAHVQRILVRERDVDRGARAAALAGRRHPGLAAPDGLADGIGRGVGQQRIAVLVLTVDAHHDRLAVALDRAARGGFLDAAAELAAQLRRGIDPGRQVRLVAARERVVEAGGDDDLAQRLAVRRRTGLASQGVLDLEIPLADMEDAEIGSLGHDGVEGMEWNGREDGRRRGPRQSYSGSSRNGSLGAWWACSTRLPSSSSWTISRKNSKRCPSGSLKYRP